eukprot:4785534-Pleurochrysis_carterae.AAC.2
MVIPPECAFDFSRVASSSSSLLYIFFSLPATWKCWHAFLHAVPDGSGSARDRRWLIGALLQPLVSPDRV